jgi:hypothetical protein
MSIYLINYPNASGAGDPLSSMNIAVEEVDWLVGIEITADY